MKTVLLIIMGVALYTVMQFAAFDLGQFSGGQYAALLVMNALSGYAIASIAVSLE